MRQAQVNNLALIIDGITYAALLAAGATQEQIDNIPAGLRQNAQPAPAAAAIPAAVAPAGPAANHQHHHVHANAEPAGEAPVPPVVVAPHPGFAFDNENRKWKLSMAAWEMWLAAIAVVIIFLGAIFLGTRFGPGEAEFQRLRAETVAAQAQVAAANAGKASADALAKLATDQLDSAKGEASRFQKKWEACMNEGCGPKK